MPKQTDSELPSSEVFSLLTGGVPYLTTLRLYFTDAEDLGRRIHAREWTGISKPLGVGSSSIAVLAVVFWIVGAKIEMGKFPAMLIEFVRDWPFFLGIAGFLATTQVVATRKFELRTFISGVLALVYVIGFFALPVGLIVLMVHFMDSILSFGKDFPLLGLVLIAPFFGYTLLFGMTRLLGESLGAVPGLCLGY